MIKVQNHEISHSCHNAAVYHWTFENECIEQTFTKQTRPETFNMKTQLIFPALAALAFVTACAAEQTADTVSTTPAQAATTEVVAFDDTALAGLETADFALDKNHAFLSAAVDHGMGLSDYTIVFKDYDATLSFNAEDLSASSISVTINPAELFVVYTGDYKAGHGDSPYETWDEDIAMNPQWLNAGEFPEITFVSTSVERTGDSSGVLTGDLTFLGVSKPVSLDITFRGNADNRWGPGKILGFDASTTFNRSDFGNSTYIPVIGDEIELEFSAEFMQIVE